MMTQYSHVFRECFAPKPIAPVAVVALGPIDKVYVRADRWRRYEFNPSTRSCFLTGAGGR